MYLNDLLDHSKLRLNYPTPKIPKNCPRHDIKSGKTPRSGKAREGQKSGYFPASKGARGQRPHGSPVAKSWLNRSHLLTMKCFPMDPQTPKCIPGGSKSSFWCLIINNTTIWYLFSTEVIKFLLIKGVKIELRSKYAWVLQLLCLPCLSFHTVDSKKSETLKKTYCTNGTCFWYL